MNISTESESITSFLSASEGNINIATITPSVNITFGGVALCNGAKVASYFNDASTSSFTYNNMMTITQSLYDMQIVYGGNITISSMIDFSGCELSVTIISLTGNITVNASIIGTRVTLVAPQGTITNNASITSTSDISIYASEITQGRLSATGQIVLSDLFSTNNCDTITPLTLNGMTYSSGTVTVTYNGRLTATATTSIPDGSITIDTVLKIVTITYNGSITVTGDITLTDSGYAVVILTPCDLIFTNSENLITKNRNASGGDVTFIVGGDLTLGNINTTSSKQSGGEIFAIAGGAVSIAGTISNNNRLGGAISLTAVQGITLAQAIAQNTLGNAGTAITLTAGGAVNLAQGVSAGTNVVSGNGASFLVTSNDAVVISGALDTSGPSSGGAVVITSGSELVLNSVTTTGVTIGLITLGSVFCCNGNLLNQVETFTNGSINGDATAESPFLFFQDTNNAYHLSFTACYPAYQCGVIGQPITLSPSSIGEDAFVFTATGLPEELSIDAATGVISGTLSNNDGSPYSITITATSPAGSAINQTTTLIIPKVTLSSDCGSTVCSGGSGNCSQSCTLTASVCGGIEPYNYAWTVDTEPSDNTGSTYSVGEGAGSHTYVVTVTDQQNCSVTSSSVTITVYDSPSVTISSSGDSGSCLGGTFTFTANASGGTPDYSYQWSLNDSNVGSNSDTYTVTISNPGDNTVSVTVTDNNGCCAENSTDVYMNQIFVSISPCDSYVYLNQDLTLTANVSGDAVAPYTYTWQWDNETIPDATNATYDAIIETTLDLTSTCHAPFTNTVGTHTYTVYVTDHNGCSGSGTATVTVQEVPAASSGSSFLQRCGNFLPDLNIGATGGNITFLAQEGSSENATISNSVTTLKFGPNKNFDPANVTVSTWSDLTTNHGGINMLTYNNMMTITESANQVQIMYGGNINIVSDIELCNTKQLVIVSFNGNITIQSGATISGSNITLIAKNDVITNNGTVTSHTNISVFATNTPEGVFNTGCNGGYALLNNYISGDDSTVVCDTSMPLTIVGISILGTTLTVDYSLNGEGSTLVESLDTTESTSIPGGSINFVNNTISVIYNGPIEITGNINIIPTFDVTSDSTVDLGYSLLFVTGCDFTVNPSASVQTSSGSLTIMAAHNVIITNAQVGANQDVGDAGSITIVAGGDVIVSSNSDNTTLLLTDSNSEGQNSAITIIAAGSIKLPVVSGLQGVIGENQNTLGGTGAMSLTAIQDIVISTIAGMQYVVQDLYEAGQGGSLSVIAGGNVTLSAFAQGLAALAIGGTAGVLESLIVIVGGNIVITEDTEAEAGLVIETDGVMMLVSGGVMQLDGIVGVDYTQGSSTTLALISCCNSELFSQVATFNGGELSTSPTSFIEYEYTIPTVTSLNFNPFLFTSDSNEGYTFVFMFDYPITSCYVADGSTPLSPIGAIGGLYYTSDNLPEGLSIDPSTGVISGVAALGTYSVTVTAALEGECPVSKTFNLIICNALTVHLETSPSWLCSVEDSSILTATAEGGTGTYTYIWKANDSLISASCNNTMTVSPGSTTTYTVTVLDGCDNTAQDTATVTLEVVSVYISPSHPILYVGASETLTAEVGGGVEPYTYQWSVDNNPIEDATNSTYLIPTNVAGTHSYSVVATDNNGCNNSASTEVIVLVNDTFSGQCGDILQDLNISQNGEITTFLMQSEGDETQAIINPLLNIAFGSLPLVDCSKIISYYDGDGTSYFIYNNMLTITESATQVQIMYGGNINLSGSQISLPSTKSLTIISFNGNISIGEASITAGAVTFISNVGTTTLLGSVTATAPTANTITIFAQTIDTSLATLTGQYINNLNLDCEPTLTIESISYSEGGNVTVNYNDGTEHTSTQSTSLSNGVITIANNCVFISYTGSIIVSGTVDLSNSGYSIYIITPCDLTVNSNILTSNESDPSGSVTLIAGGELTAVAIDSSNVDGAAGFMTFVSADNMVLSDAINSASSNSTNGSVTITTSMDLAISGSINQSNTSNQGTPITLTVGGNLEISGVISSAAGNPSATSPSKAILITGNSDVQITGSLNSSNTGSGQAGGSVIVVAGGPLSIADVNSASGSSNGLIFLASIFCCNGNFIHQVETFTGGILNSDNSAENPFFFEQDTNGAYLLALAFCYPSFQCCALNDVISIMPSHVASEGYHFSTTGLPNGLAINCETGEISGTLSCIEGSPFYIQITATPISGPTVYQTIILIAPHVTLSPVDANVCIGSEITLTVMASGGVPPYSYLWEDNGTIISDATSSIYEPIIESEDDLTNTWQSAFVDTIGTYTYLVTVTDSYGCTSTASTTVTVNELPSVYISSSSEYACVGTTITLTANASEGQSPYTYQWYNCDNNPIVNATNSTYDVSFNDAGNHSYSVTVIDYNGCSSSASTEISFEEFGVSVNASSAETCIGGSVTISVEVDGGYSPYTYVWTWNGQLLEGVNTDTYVALIETEDDLTNTSQAAFTDTIGSYTYHVTVTDQHGCVNSNYTTIIVNSAVSVTVTASSDAVCLNETLTLTAHPEGGNGSYSYQWYQGESSIDGATHCEYCIPTGSSGNYTYSVVVTDNYSCSGQSAPIAVTVNQTPNVTLTPNDPTVYVGQPLVLTANASGGLAPYNYVWQRNSETIEDATSSTYSADIETLADLTNESHEFFVDTAGSYTYTVIVTDDNGCSSTASSTVTVVVPGPLTVTFGASTASVLAGTPFTLAALAEGGAGGYTYTWSGPNAPMGPQSSSVVMIVAPTSPGPYSYSVLVTDLNGTTVQSITVTITVLFNAVNPSYVYPSNSFLGQCGAQLIALNIGGKTDSAITFLSGNEGDATAVLNTADINLSFDGTAPTVSTSSYDDNANVASLTYDNLFTITQSPTHVQIIYGGDINVSSAITLAEGQSLTILSFSGNVTINANISADDITIIAKNGTVVRTNAMTATAGNISIFADSITGSGTLTGTNIILNRQVNNDAGSLASIDCTSGLTISDISFAEGGVTIEYQLSSVGSPSTTSSSVVMAGGAIDVDATNKIITIIYGGALTLSNSVTMDESGYSIHLIAGCDIITADINTDGAITLTTGGAITVTAANPHNGIQSNTGAVILTSGGESTINGTSIGISTSHSPNAGFVIITSGSGVSVSGSTNGIDSSGTVGGGVLINAGGPIAIAHDVNSGTGAITLAIVFCSNGESAVQVTTFTGGNLSDPSSVSDPFVFFEDSDNIYHMDYAFSFPVTLQYDPDTFTVVSPNVGTGGVTYTYSLADGAILPTGMVLDASTGVIYGTPTTKGVYTVKVIASVNPVTNATVTLWGGTLSITASETAANIGDVVTLTANADFGDDITILHYQWYQDGVLIPDATDETYVAPTEDVGSHGYTVTVTALVGGDLTATEGDILSTSPQSNSISIFVSITGTIIMRCARQACVIGGTLTDLVNNTVGGYYNNMNAGSVNSNCMPAGMIITIGNTVVSCADTLVNSSLHYEFAQGLRITETESTITIYYPGPIRIDATITTTKDLIIMASAGPSDIIINGNITARNIVMTAMGGAIAIESNITVTAISSSDTDSTNQDLGTANITLFSDTFINNGTLVTSDLGFVTLLVNNEPTTGTLPQNYMIRNISNAGTQQIKSGINVNQTGSVCQTAAQFTDLDVNHGADYFLQNGNECIIIHGGDVILPDLSARLNKDLFVITTCNIATHINGIKTWASPTDIAHNITFIAGDTIDVRGDLNLSPNGSGIGGICTLIAQNISGTQANVLVCDGTLSASGRVFMASLGDIKFNAIGSASLAENEGAHDVITLSAGGSITVNTGIYGGQVLTTLSSSINIVAGLNLVLSNNSSEGIAAASSLTNAGGNILMVCGGELNAQNAIFVNVSAVGENNAGNIFVTTGGDFGLQIVQIKGSALAGRGLFIVGGPDAAIISDGSIDAPASVAFYYLCEAPANLIETPHYQITGLWSSSIAVTSNILSTSASPGLAYVYDTVTLTATLSDDDGNENPQWTLIEYPEGFSDPTILAPGAVSTFVPTVGGTYVAQIMTNSMQDVCSTQSQQNCYITKNLRVIIALPAVTNNIYLVTVPNSLALFKQLGRSRTPVVPAALTAYLVTGTYSGESTNISFKKLRDLFKLASINSHTYTLHNGDAVIFGLPPYTPYYISNGVSIYMEGINAVVGEGAHVSVTLYNTLLL